MNLCPRSQAEEIIRDIEDAENRLFDLIGDCLKAPEKEFNITYGKKNYHFYPVFEVGERKKMNRERLKLINALIKDAFHYYTSSRKKHNQHAWDAILGIIGGENPEDHKFVKHEAVDVGPVLNEKGEIVKAIELNLNNYQVKENLGLLDEQR